MDLVLHHRTVKAAIRKAVDTKYIKTVVVEPLPELPQPRRLRQLQGCFICTAQPDSHRTVSGYLLPYIGQVFLQFPEVVFPAYARVYIAAVGQVTISGLHGVM